jgi:hypothetical protein
MRVFFGRAGGHADSSPTHTEDKLPPRHGERPGAAAWADARPRSRARRYK